MRKRVLLFAAALLAVAVTASVALAAVNVKTFPQATFGDPNPASVTLSAGEFSGLGTNTAIATLTVTGVATYDCHNNGNPDNIVPGQNPVPAAPGSAPPQDLGNADHNGRGFYPGGTASVSDPGATPKQVGCGGKGSGNWTVVLKSLTATGANLTITEGNKVVFCRDYTLGGDPIGTAC